MRGLAARSIDRYLPEDARAILEERFWQTVEEKSTLEASLAAAVPSCALRSSSR
jgi:hypothetical protein